MSRPKRPKAATLQNLGNGPVKTEQSPIRTKTIIAPQLKRPTFHFVALFYGRSFIERCFSALSAVMCYQFVLRQGGFVWDDVAIQDSRVVQQWGGLFDIWFRPLQNVHEQHYWPLTYSGFWLEHKMWGLWPAGFRGTNILMHGINVVLLNGLLYRLGLGAVVATWAALLWGAHPARAESVAWIIERKDVQSGLFYLLAFHALISHESTPNKRFPALAFLAYAAALLSKSIAVTLPAAWLLSRWWRTGHISPREWRTAIQFSAVGAAFCVTDSIYGSMYYPDKHGIPFATRILEIAPVIPWFHAEHFAWPFGAYPDKTWMALYPKWSGVVQGIRAWVGLAAITVSLVVVARRSRRGPLAAWLFYLGTLFPVCGVIPFGFLWYSYTADRFSYLPTIGLAVLSLGFIREMAKLCEPHVRNPSVRTAAFVTGMFLITVVNTPTAVWARYYGDAEALWSHNVKLNPASFEAQQQYGRVLSHDAELRTGGDRKKLTGDTAKRLDDGIVHLRESVRLEPRYAAGHYNLGTALHLKGDGSAAEAAFRNALALDGDYTLAWNGLGAVLGERGSLAEAIKCFEKAVELDPNNAEAAENLASALSPAPGPAAPRP